MNSAMNRRLAQITSVIGLLCLLLGASGAQERQSAARSQLDAAIAVVDPTERIAALEGFIAKNSDGELNLTAREEIVRSRAELAELQLKENNIGSAMALLRQAVAELPERVSDRFFERAVAQMPVAVSARGYRTEAIALARLIEERFAKEPMRLGALGEFYLNLESPHDAIRALEAAIRLRREDVRLRRPLAAAYRMSLRLDDAEKELQQVAALDPADRRAYADLGNLARARGEYEEAERLYRSQLSTDEANAAALKGIALVHLAAGRGEQAAAELDKIRKLKGAEEVDADLHLQTQMGFYFLLQGKYPQANLAIVQAVAREPRYSWARIAAAELDIAEGRYFQAESHLIAALRYADFPTLRFTLGKLYLVVEDWDGAIEQFAQAFTLARSGKFAARLGGILDFEADRLDVLLAREREAAIFISKPITTDEQFRLAETLFRLDARLRSLKTGGAEAARPRAGRIARGSSVEAEIETLGNAFVNVEGQRRAFRALYVARRLAEAGQAAGYVQKLTALALDLAESATAAVGSVPEYPNYDSQGRLRIVRGRAYDALGWSHFQQERHREAIDALTRAVEAYGDLPEGKRAIWHLATVRETAGEHREALDLYIAGYEPPESGATTDVKRAVIEVLYRKVHGSLNGLDEKLGKPVINISSAGASSTAKPPAEEGGAKENGVGARSSERKGAETRVEEKPERAGGAPKSVIANLPAAADRRVRLALPRLSPAAREAGSLVVSDQRVPRPGRLLESEVADLVSVTPPEGLRLVPARINARLLRWPFKSSAETAPAPETIAVDGAEPAAPRGRPRRVPAAEQPKTSDETPPPTRSRRVRTPR